MTGGFGEDYSREQSAGQMLTEGDDGSDEEDMEASASPVDKASLTAKLHEMERDVAALKRVLNFM